MHQRFVHQRETMFSELIEDKEQIHPLVQRWYRLIIPAFQLVGTESFDERERIRRVRLLAKVLFCFLVVAAVFLPACLLLPNPWIFWLDLVLLVASLITIILTRLRLSTPAGAFLIIIYELVVAGIIFTTVPLDEPSIQYYDVCIIGLLLCVVLLPPRSVFVAASLNTLMTFVSLMWQPHNDALRHDLAGWQFVPIFLRPAALQFIVAGVCYLFVTDLVRANFRANRAENVARLEHVEAEEGSIAVQKNEQLEADIQYLRMYYVAMMNHQIPEEPFPYPESKVLWPLVGALNAQRTRLRRTQQAERDLWRLQSAIAMYMEQIAQGVPLSQVVTDTMLDPLVAALVRRASARNNSVSESMND